MHLARFLDATDSGFNSRSLTNLHPLEMVISRWGLQLEMRNPICLRHALRYLIVRRLVTSDDI